MPTAASITIVLDNHAWTVEELNHTALAQLRRAESLRDDLALQAAVRIRPKDKNHLCEFIYSQGFDRPYWRVSIGYDGKVTNIDKRMKREATD